ncbi:hypothetical protein WN990_14080 [Kitasatospora purpeofusca]|uniref:hypothetical protein n=1 Tax=Kitasatospora purpeofusca TaxID=67352 RepID=UPI0030F0D096
MVIRPARLRVVAVSLVSVLPVALSCTAAKDDENVPIAGVWKSSFGTIHFLEDGTLGEASLLPAACNGKASPDPVAFTGTWLHETVSDAGPGAYVTLTSTAGDLTCKRFFGYYKHDGRELLQLTATDAGSDPFLRQT